MFADTHTSLQCVYMFIKLTIFKYTSVYIPNFLVFVSWVYITLVETPNCSVYPFLASVCLSPLCFRDCVCVLHSCETRTLGLQQHMWKPLEDAGLFLPETHLFVIYSHILWETNKTNCSNYPGSNMQKSSI